MAECGPMPLCSVFSPSCLAYVCGYECFLPCYHIHWQDGAVSDGRTATLAQKLLQSKWRNGNEITQHHCAQKHRPLELRESCCRLLWTSEGCKWASASPQGLSGSLGRCQLCEGPFKPCTCLEGMLWVVNNASHPEHDGPLYPGNAPKDHGTVDYVIPCTYLAANIQHTLATGSGGSNIMHYVILVER